VDAVDGSSTAFIRRKSLLTTVSRVLPQRLRGYLQRRRRLVILRRGIWRLSQRVRGYFRERHRWFVLRRAIRSLRRNPSGSDRVWRDLVYGWGGGWSAGSEYLDAVAAAAVAERGPILECGSGLTTLVLAAIARRTGSSIWTLEDDPDWYRAVESGLERLRLHADVQLTPLRSYGDFDWFGTDPSLLPTFSLVVCDGPAGSTRGGRLGLLPVLRGRLARGCTILLDDASRASEQEILRSWESQTPLTYEIKGHERPYAVVTLT
jgi:Methyltransferase domain